jgi:cytochrome oxidase assembly protein ShyY1
VARPFLLRTRWLVGHVIIVLLVIGMYLLGQWQLDRLEKRRERNTEVETELAAKPLTTLPDSATPNYRTVELTGTWDAAATRLLRYPIREGAPGYEVLTPLVLASGERILVDRGWIPLEQGKVLKAADAAPTGITTVPGWFRKPKSGSENLGQNDVQAATITKITEPWVQARPGYNSVAGAVAPIPIEPPDLSEGPHWSYFLQWISFCLIAIGGWGALLYRSWKDEQYEP